jgi:predicted protein tyrosine phosphatase
VCSPRICVSALWQNQLARDLDKFQPSHVLSVLDPDVAPPTLAPVSKHLAINVRDTTESSIDETSQYLLISAFRFIDQATDQHLANDARLLIHCHLGVSRSTALAYVALAKSLQSADDAFSLLLKITNKPWPNRGIVEFADAYLGYRGQLVAPLDAYRQRFPARLQVYRRFNRIHKRT